MEAENAPSTEEQQRTLKAKKSSRRRRQLAVLVSVVAAVVVVVERFLAEHTPLLLPSQTSALSASVQAATLALAKLQIMLEVADGHLSASPLSALAAVSPRKPVSPFRQFLSSADAHQWRRNFRMGKPAFLSLLRMLEPDLAAPATAASDDAPAPPAPEVKLGATLYRLATASSLRAVVRKFDIPGGVASFLVIFEEVCRALQAKLSSLFDFPSMPELLRPIMYQFKERGLPNCCGVIGCTRFPVMPTDSNREYFESSAGYPAVAMQGVVDASGRLLDISVGWGGSMPAAQILLQTRLFSRVMDTHELLHGPPEQLLTGAPMPQYIIGDSSYPLLPWLLTPYPKAIAASPQLVYNRVHEQVRSIASRAFGTLKASWRLLSSGDLTAGDGCIIAAACILHNYLIYSGEALVEEKEPLVRELCSLPPCHNSYGDSIRDALAAHLTILSQSYPRSLPS